MLPWAWLWLEGGGRSLAQVAFPPSHPGTMFSSTRTALELCLLPRSSLRKEGCSWTKSSWPRPGVGRAAQGTEPKPLGEQQDTLLRKREILRKAPQETHTCKPAGEVRRRQGLSQRCGFPSTPLLDASMGQDLLPTSSVSEDRTHRKGEQRSSLSREWSSSMAEKSGREWRGRRCRRNR